MKQQLIVTSSAAEFDIKVNGLLSEGWYYVPDTFKALMNAAGNQERYTMLLVQDEESDEIIAAIKQQMAMGSVGGCQCHGDTHHEAVPPPYYQCPNNEPKDPECNPGA